MAVIPAAAIVAGNARRLGDSFVKKGITIEEKAVTIQEMYDDDSWTVGGIRPMRMRAIEVALRFLVRKKKVVKTEDDKYYLVLDKLKSSW